MSLDACIPKLIGNGSIDMARTDALQARYSAMVERDRARMGEAAARSNASSEIVGDVRRESMQSRRRSLLQVERQRAMAE
jgi:hypothetical protein